MSIQRRYKGILESRPRLLDPVRNKGHNDVRTTMIYTHVPNRGGNGVRSPLDLMQAAVAR